MESEHKRRLLERLAALAQAVKEEELPDDMLEAVYQKLFMLDELFPEGVKTHSVRELKGLGKELWRSMDVDKYLEEERASWD